MTSVHCPHIACIPGTFIRERFKVFSGVLRPFLTFHPQCIASPSWFDTIEQSVTTDHLFTISPLMISWWKSRCHQAYVTQPFAMPNSPRFREVTSWLGASRPVHSRFDLHPRTTTHWQWPLTKSVFMTRWYLMYEVNPGWLGSIRGEEGPLCNVHDCIRREGQYLQYVCKLPWSWLQTGAKNYTNSKRFITSWFISP